MGPICLPDSECLDMMTYSRLSTLDSCSRFDAALFLLSLRCNLNHFGNVERFERFLNACSVTIWHILQPTQCPPHYFLPRSPDCLRRWFKPKRLAPSLRAAFLSLVSIRLFRSIHSLLPRIIEMTRRRDQKDRPRMWRDPEGSPSEIA